MCPKKWSLRRIQLFQRKVQRAKRRRREWKKNHNKSYRRIKSSSGTINKKSKNKLYYPGYTYKRHTVKAPQIFSLIENPSNVIKFINSMKFYLNTKGSIFMDFRDIKKVTPDAIALLIAMFHNFKDLRENSIVGVRPIDQELDKIFSDSGFYKMIGLDKYVPVKGAFYSEGNTIVDIEVAVEVRKKTTMNTFSCDIHYQPLYRTIIECMANTKKHAKGTTKRDEKWWLMSYYDSSSKITTVSFIDTGVGIFESTKIKRALKLLVSIGIKTRGDILRSILKGEIESSTGLPYRGKGLPKIYDDFKRKHIHSLHIISNNAYADVANENYYELTDSLKGTFLYWQILPKYN